MKIRAGLLPWGTALATMLALGGCNLPAEEAWLPAPSAAGRPVARDAGVTMKVKAALLGDANTQDLDIEVVTLKGDVRLTGLVNSQSRIDHVIKVARSIEGARSIHDELGLRQSDSFSPPDRPGPGQQVR